MPTCTVLVEGYVRLHSAGGWTATSTSTLIAAPDHPRIVVDPGCNRALLLAGLSAHGLTPDDVDLVFLTHHHLDHILNVALFPRALVADYEAIYDRDTARPLGPTLPGTDIRVVATAGHADDHASLVVPTDRGTVAVAGDVFWWADDEPPGLDVDRSDMFASDPARLRDSRRLLLTLADWIVPGHGRALPVARPGPP